MRQRRGAISSVVDGRAGSLWPDSIAAMGDSLGAKWCEKWEK